MDRLAGRTAIITGAASGIGRATAELFAAEGCRVLAIDRPGADLSFSDEAIASFACDVTDEEAPQAIIGEAEAHLGGIDILFNNAGIGVSAPVDEMSDAVWDRVQAVNLRAVFRLTRAAIPLLVQSTAGRIINTASVMAEGTDYGLAAYSASKAGVVGVTRTLALELGRHAITANAILPGAIHTGMTASSFANPDIANAWAKKSPLKRLGQPIDVARAVLFLASEDGGMRLRL